MARAIPSMELAQVLAEAEDIARSVNQKLTSAHQLLAFFTVPNRAEILLRERGVDEDRILASMSGAPKERDGLERDLRERAREIADGTGAGEVDCLHLLIAMSRVRASSAHQLLTACKLSPATLGNVALSYYTSRMPRRLREVQPVRVGPPAATPPRATPRPPTAEDEPAATPAPGDADANAPASAADLELDDLLDRLPDLAKPLVQPRAAPSSLGHSLSPSPSPGRARGKEPLGKHALDPSDFPWLSSLGRNLTELAAAHKLDPLVGREREVEEAIDVLGKRRTNNPLLVGEPGVGKTAIVEGIAQRLLGDAHGRGRVLVEIDMASVVAGTQLRGSFSEKMNGIKEEVRRAKGKVVVFIDEIHTLMGAGSTGEGPQDAANELKAALARGEFPCIGATTHDEYRKHIEKDPALERRFSPILVREPTVADTVTILSGIAPHYAQHHAVRYAPEALEAAATLSARFITDRFLPDKAVAVLDLAGSRARRERREVVGATEVAKVVAKMAGLPEARLLSSDRERILALEGAVRERIVGHDGAIGRVAAVVKRNFAGFASRRPMGSFLFLGPTGVGKSEFARALAESLFGSTDAMVQLDMTECAEPTGVAKLVGAAPGYVGYGEGGQLTDAIRRRPSCVVVLDEIEKAHRDVQLLLLQVLEEGRLTDGRGRQVDFSNAVVILTSNLGADEALKKTGGSMGFGASDREPGREDRALQAARQAVPPELWNRLDDRILFPPLDREAVIRIAGKLLVQSSGRLHAERKIRFAASPGVAELLLDSGGWDPALGARPMRGAIQRLVEGPLAEKILSGAFAAGDAVAVDAVDGEIRFTRAAIA